MIIYFSPFLKRKPSAIISRGQENSRGTTSVYPKRGLMGSKQIRRLYRALPVFAYLSFSKAAPKGIPYPPLLCLAPSGSSLGRFWDMYWFSSTRCLVYSPQFSTSSDVSQHKNVLSHKNRCLFLATLSYAPHTVVLRRNNTYSLAGFDLCGIM